MTKEENLRQEAERALIRQKGGLLTLLVDFAKSEVVKEYHSDAIEFSEWIESKYFKIIYNKWNNKIDESDEKDYTTAELYDLFTKHKT
jgi:hypothetical protein